MGSTGIDITLDHSFGTVNARFGIGANIAVTKQFKYAMKLCGQVVAEEVRRGWSGAGRDGWAHLHPFTSIEKGHTDPLYHSGALMDSVVVVQDDSAVAIGVNDPVQAKKALIQERGATITVTPRMRGFLASRGFVLKKTTNFLVIPARPNFSRALGEKLPELASIVTMTIEDHYARVASGAA